MPSENNFESTVLLITNDGLGRGDQELGQKLAASYLTLLLEAELLPAAICFYTEGVRLVVEGSPLLAELQEMEGLGVRLIACGTCLKYYGLTESIVVGLIGGMTDIIEAQRRASKVITL